MSKRHICLEITEAVTLAFFDQHLKGAPRDTFAALLKKYPELINAAINP